MRVGRVLLVRLLTLAMTASPGLLDAQGRRTTMALTGWPLTVTETDGAAFEAGFVLLGTTTFTVDATTNNPNFSPRSTTVQIQCVAACPRSGSLPLAGLQWRRNDQVSWTTLTTAYVTVEQRNVTFGGTNDPWSNSMLWRYNLSWTGTPPTAVSQFRIRFRLVVAAP